MLISIEVVSVAFGIVPLNFHTKWLLWNVHMHFDFAGSHKTGVAVLALGIFLMHKIALLTCPCAFRQRRLAQNAGPGRRIRHFPGKFPYKRALVRSPVERSRHFGPVRSRSLWHGANSEIARATLSALWARQMALAMARCSFWDGSRNPLVTLGLSHRSRCGAVLVGWSRRSCAEILTRRSLIQSFPRDLVQRS